MNILLFFSGLTLIFGIAFFYLKIKLPSTLWLGITFLGFLFNLVLVFFVFLVQENLQAILIALAVIYLFILLLMPVLMIGTFVVNGVKIIRNEGFKLANTLSLVLGIGIVIYLLVWPSVVDVTTNHLLNTLYQFISFTAVYLSFILVFYTITNLINLVHFKQIHADYYIVLGAGLDGDKVTPILASRINKGIERQKKQGDGKIIFSGGKGDDEFVAEGTAMYDYALDRGVDSETLLKETDSTNTRQNIQFSKEIIAEDWEGEAEPSIAIVTNNYHVLRALMQARIFGGINAVGYGSNTKFYYSLNAFLREFVAYLQMTFKIHGTVIGIAGTALFGLFLLVEVINIIA